MAITISKDKSLLHVKLIHDFLSKSYWAMGRSLEEVEKTIQYSECYGIYSNDEQIGFARLVTDFTIYAYLMDVFIIKKYRQKGLGIRLMKYIIEDPKLAHVKQWSLRTKDAHLLYEKFGFKLLENPEYSMSKLT